MITQHFILHMVPDDVRPRIYLSQRSSGLEKLQFTLIGTNGTYYTIPAGTSISFVGSKPDKKSFSYACTYSGHTVNVDVTEQMTAVAGIVKAELRFENSSGAILPSQNMELVIERSPLDGSVCSKNDFAYVDEEIISIHQEAVLTKDYAAQAKESADTASTIISDGIEAVDSKVASATSSIQSTANSATSTINTTVDAGKRSIDAAVQAAIDSILAYGQSSVSIYYTQSTANFEIETID